MIAKIAHGNASGQFAYNAMSAPVATYNGGAKTWSSAPTRIFNNNSGGSITVGEVGLMWNGTCFGSTTHYLFERSVLSPTVAVANGAQLTVTYTITMD